MLFCIRTKEASKLIIEELIKSHRFLDLIKFILFYKNDFESLANTGTSDGVYNRSLNMAVIMLESITSKAREQLDIEEYLIPRLVEVLTHEQLHEHSFYEWAVRKVARYNLRGVDAVIRVLGF